MMRSRTPVVAVTKGLRHLEVEKVCTMTSSKLRERGRLLSPMPASLLHRRVLFSLAVAEIWLVSAFPPPVHAGLTGGLVEALEELKLW
jgi:hypothetical protein